MFCVGLFVCMLFSCGFSLLLGGGVGEGEREPEEVEQLEELDLLLSLFLGGVIRLILMFWQMGFVAVIVVVEVFGVLTVVIGFVVLSVLMCCGAVLFAVFMVFLKGGSKKSFGFSFSVVVFVVFALVLLFVFFVGFLVVMVFLGISIVFLVMEMELL